MDKVNTDVGAPSSSNKNASDLDEEKIRQQIKDAVASVDQTSETAHALSTLLTLEKQCRLAEDMALSRETCLAILQVCEKAGSWQELLDHITILTKRRGQLKSTIQGIVRKATEMFDCGRTKDEQIALIQALQAVTEGKIFVEIDRARLTKRLARIYEADGKIAEAADAMQEIAVETFGAMHRTEKIAYVLAQMRLCMDNGDFTRAQILSRKVSPKAYAAGSKEQAAGEISLQGTAIEAPEEGTPTMPELKHLYYNQMIRFHKHTNNYIEIVRCLLATYADIKDDASKGLPLLKQIVWYLVLCPTFSTAEGSASDYLTLRSTVADDAQLQDIPDHKDLLQIFITQEVMGVQALLTRYRSEMDQQTEIFGGEEGKTRAEDFQSRITEHNIMVVAKYYSELRLQRLAQLLNLSPAAAEEHLSALAVKSAVDAKIDRLEGIVRFQPRKDSVQVLDSWSHSITKLLTLVETSCQKIQKESMQHNVPIGIGA